MQRTATAVMATAVRSGWRARICDVISVIRRHTHRHLCADGQQHHEPKPANYGLFRRHSLKRVADEGQHAAPEHDADPQEQGHAADNFGCHWGVIIRSKHFNSPGRAGNIEHEYVDSGESDEEHLEAEGDIVAEHRWISGVQQGAGDQVDAKSNHR